MRLLITGAAGFIGYHTTKRFLEEGHTIIGIDSINDYYDPALKFARLAELGIGKESKDWLVPVRSTKYTEFIFQRMKLEDRASIEALFREQNFDRVIHLAAQAGVRYSIDHPYEYIDSNIVGFLNILEGCRHSQVAHLVYASSSSVYGLNSKRPFSTHDHTDHPVSLYAATKKANELMAHTYSHLYGIPTTGLRFFTVYGPWGRPDMAYFKFTKAILEGRPIKVYNNGEMWRDFTYIDDIVEGIRLVTDDIPQPDEHWNPEKPDPASSSAPYRIFNLGNNKPIRLMEFIQIIENHIGKKAIIEYKPMQAGDVVATEADIEILENLYRWKPSMNIEHGLKIYIRWYCNNYGVLKDE
jgi:UDP-glucuronate 4-epimerase